MQQTPPDELATFSRFVKTLWFALFASVCLYWPMLKLLPMNAAAAPTPAVLQALTLAAAGSSAAVLILRFNRISAVLSRLPLEPAALAQLRTLYILCYVLAESVALYGLVLYFLGAPREQAAYFFIGSVALFLLCYPRTPETPLGLPPQ